MKKNQKIKLIIETLEKLYPNPPVPLKHVNNFTLLIAVLLSAQSTDKKVNELTPELFKKASDPKNMFLLGESEIFSKINKLGLAKQKAKNIYKLSSILHNIYSDKVPDSFCELESLPGVGHKTASIVLAQAYGIPTFPVDTHIHRLAQRWEITNGLNVKQTEKDLKRIFPKDKWNTLHLQIIFYGREYCTAKGCNGTICPLCKTLFPKRRKPVIHRKA